MSCAWKAPLQPIAHSRRLTPCSSSASGGIVSAYALPPMGTGQIQAEAWCSAQRSSPPADSRDADESPGNILLNETRFARKGVECTLDQLSAGDVAHRVMCKLPVRLPDPAAPQFYDSGE